MDIFSNMDWETLFIPKTPILELFLRGSLVYLSLFVMLRVFKRSCSQMSISDLLLLVLIADAAQGALASPKSNSITDGVLTVGFIILWNYVLDWLGYHSKFFAKILHPRETLIVRDGKYLRDNMARELVTENEILSELREKDIEGLNQVKEGYLEGHGKISLITKKKNK